MTVKIQSMAFPACLLSLANLSSVSFAPQCKYVCRLREFLLSWLWCSFQSQPSSDCLMGYHFVWPCRGDGLRGHDLLFCDVHYNLWTSDDTIVVEVFFNPKYITAWEAPGLVYFCFLFDFWGHCDLVSWLLTFHHISKRCTSSLCTPNRSNSVINLAHS
jgi:hypothetical protein